MHGDNRRLTARGAVSQSARWWLRRLWRVGLAVGMTLATLEPRSAGASELTPLEIAMVTFDGARHYEPTDGKFVITRQPLELFIRIRNTSSAAILVRVNPERAYSVELTDAAGRLFTLDRKAATGNDPNDDPRVYLSPGAERIVRMEINRDTWQGFPEFAETGDSVFSARVVYQNAEGMRLRSKSYTLVIRRNR